jgi:hypothetical protein
MALRLSQCRSVGEYYDVSKSTRNQQNHNISEVVSARARYSESVLEQAVKVCFLLRQDIRESPKKNPKTSGGTTITKITGTIGVRVGSKNQ